MLSQQQHINMQIRCSVYTMFNGKTSLCFLQRRYKTVLIKENFSKKLFFIFFSYSNQCNDMRKIQNSQNCFWGSLEDIETHTSHQNSTYFYKVKICVYIYMNICINMTYSMSPQYLCNLFYINLCKKFVNSYAFFWLILTRK